MTSLNRSNDYTHGCYDVSKESFSHGRSVGESKSHRIRRDFGGKEAKDERYARDGKLRNELGLESGKSYVGSEACDRSIRNGDGSSQIWVGVTTRIVQGVADACTHNDRAVQRRKLIYTVRSGRPSACLR